MRISKRSRSRRRGFSMPMMMLMMGGSLLLPMLMGGGCEGGAGGAGGLGGMLGGLLGGGDKKAEATAAEGSAATKTATRSSEGSETAPLILPDLPQIRLRPPSTASAKTPAMGSVVRGLGSTSLARAPASSSLSPEVLALSRELLSRPLHPRAPGGSSAVVAAAYPLGPGVTTGPPVRASMAPTPVLDDRRLPVLKERAGAAYASLQAALRNQDRQAIREAAAALAEAQDALESGRRDLVVAGR